MPNRLNKTLKLLLVLLMPVVIVTAAVRLLTTDQYLAYEYNKAGFPPDSFGFTQRQRFVFASTNIHYVQAHLPSDELARQTLNSTTLYTPREVSHMEDVRTVFGIVFRSGQIAWIVLALIGFILWQKGERRTLSLALKHGGVLTSVVILVIGLLAVFAWQFWFETFHLFFFKPGSWLFSYTDTLIRLFPEKFWFDAAVTISFSSLVAGLLTAFIGRRWQSAIQQAR